MLKHNYLLPVLLFFIFTNNLVQSQEAPRKEFNIEKDLLLLHYDCKTDVDDIHSIAAFGTLLSNLKYAQIQYHAVAGAYGTQKGLYVPSDALCNLTFGNKWSDAHQDFDKALQKVTEKALTVLEAQGDIWIAEGGQSDFSAALVKQIQAKKPELNTLERIHLIQHSDWNEENTSPDNLTFVKNNTDYQKIPDGNKEGNGTPGFRSDQNFNLDELITKEHPLAIWHLAIEIANNYNGKEERYLNKDIDAGGLDFSDFSEVCWVFGLEKIIDAEDFFKNYQ